MATAATREAHDVADRATSSKWLAYSEACVPASSTRSSAARSRIFKNSRQAVHASGFHQYKLTATRARNCVATSPRRTCASSCISTACRRSTLHSEASAGRKIAGCSIRTSSASCPPPSLPPAPLAGFPSRAPAASGLPPRLRSQPKPPHRRPRKHRPREPDRIPAAQINATISPQSGRHGVARTTRTSALQPQPAHPRGPARPNERHARRHLPYCPPRYMQRRQR